MNSRKTDVPKKLNERLESIDMLRGIAALSVCLFHFSCGNESFLRNGFWIKSFLSYGHLGVQMFFIISGFVIPYSLYQVNHQFRNTKRYLLRRILRVDPPYIITIFLIIVLNYLSTLSPYYHGTNYCIDFYNLALHFGYVNSFVGQPWLNPVFWTLAIEFQFYIAMALLFPLLTSKKKWLSASTYLIFLLSSLMTTNNALIFNNNAFFALGILIFYYRINFFNRKALLAAIFLVLLFIYYYNSPALLYVSTFTFATICFLKNWNNRFLLFLGTISYSLYLVHVPIGGRMINLSINFIEGNYSRTLLMILITISIILISYFFYKAVERPSIALSKKINVNNTNSIENRMD